MSKDINDALKAYRRGDTRLMDELIGEVKTSELINAMHDYRIFANHLEEIIKNRRAYRVD